MRGGKLGRWVSGDGESARGGHVSRPRLELQARVGSQVRDLVELSGGADPQVLGGIVETELGAVGFTELARHPLDDILSRVGCVELQFDHSGGDGRLDGENDLGRNGGTLGPQLELQQVLITNAI